MNRKARLAAVLAAGALTAGGVAVAAPAIAGNGPFAHPAATASVQPGQGSGQRLRDGSCLADVPSGTLTSAQRTTLASMADREKLAGDLYAAFAATYPAAVFDHLAKAEDQHLTAIRTLLTRYGVTDPTAGKPAGQFGDPDVQARYDQLLAQGNASQAAAYTVGLQVEAADVAALRQALTGLSAADVTRVYTNLRTAEQRHQQALTTWAGR